MISLVKKKNNINLTSTGASIEIEQKETKDITLTPEESSIELAATNDNLEFKENYIKGEDGEDGFSPTVKVTEFVGGYSVDITDKDGTKNFVVRHGKDGEDGEQGENGLSPIVEVYETEEGHLVSITDAEGVKEFLVKDGEGGGAALVEGDNTVIEDNAINVYTNTGYAVSDKDIKLQPILDNNTYGENHIVYTDNEVMIIYNGTLKIKRSTNGIDFESIQLPYSCKSMFYNPNNKRIYGLCNNYFIYSDDDGLTWQSQKSTSYAGSTATYICRGESHINGLRVVHKNTKRLYSLSDTFAQSGMITSTIYPEFVTQFADYQFIWCNAAGTFKYAAGSQEGTFASLSGVAVQCLKNIEGYPIVGLRNDNKLYRLKNYKGVTDNEWVAYNLPDTCTVYDITFNPYDKTYYLFTSVNTYYKTKDFVLFESVDKDGLRGREAQFTLMGIQATVNSENNTLLLAPTRTKLENKAQEWDRALNKERWIGDGLELVGEQVRVKVRAPLNASSYGIGIGQLEDYHLPEMTLEASYVALAPLILDFDPYSIDTWYWEEGYPVDNYSAHKVVFNQEGSFWDQMNWETEYIVEQYEYGYIFSDYDTMKYVKLGNLAPLFN